jgi:hypothetical protein
MLIILQISKLAISFKVWLWLRSCGCVPFGLVEKYFSDYLRILMVGDILVFMFCQESLIVMKFEMVLKRVQKDVEDLKKFVWFWPDMTKVCGTVITGYPCFHGFC